MFLCRCERWCFSVSVSVGVSVPVCVGGFVGQCGFGVFLSHSEYGCS